MILHLKVALRPAKITPRGSTPTILLVDDLLPDPTFGAGYPRAFAITRTLFGAGFAVEHYPLASTPSDHAKMSDLFAGRGCFHQGRGTHGLRRLLLEKGHSFDVVFVSRPGPMAALLRSRWRPVVCGVAPLVYDAEAVLAPREKRRLALFSMPWSESKYRAALARELQPARAAKLVTAVGVADAAAIRSVLDTPVLVLPHSVSARAIDPDPASRTDLLFVGRLTGRIDESPNVDSVHWFVTAVMPLLDRLIGTNYRVNIAGLVDAPEITALASERVIFHGVVEQLDLQYREARLFVAPTRYAAGIPLKVVEAMGEGLPCVITSLLAGQLGIGSEIVAHADNAQDFARECARLYSDDAAWADAQALGSDYVRRTASPEAFDELLLNIVSRFVERSGSGKTMHA